MFSSRTIPILISIAGILFIVVIALLIVNHNANPDECNRVLALSAYENTYKREYCQAKRVCEKFYDGEALDFCIKVEIIASDLNR